MLIESIYKEIAATTAVNTDNDSKNRLASEFYQEKDGNQSERNLIQKQDNLERQEHEDNSECFLRAKNLFGGVHQSLLEELKTRKISTNNWNQKITIELVECKIKLKQLIMEMYFKNVF